MILLLSTLIPILFLSFSFHYVQEKIRQAGGIGKDSVRLYVLSQSRAINTKNRFVVRRSVRSEDAELL